MATKKTEIPAAQNAYPDEKLVTIKLPLTKEQRDDVFVRVNQRTWLIKRGEYVQVPECVQEVLEHAESAIEDSILYQQEHEKVLE